jgi:hypothetical protein
MIEFFSTLVRLFKAIVGAWRRDPQFRTLVSPVFFTLLRGCADRRVAYVSKADEESI